MKCQRVLVPGWALVEVTAGFSGQSVKNWGPQRSGIITEFS